MLPASQVLGLQILILICSSLKDICSEILFEICGPLSPVSKTNKKFFPRSASASRSKRDRVSRLIKLPSNQRLSRPAPIKTVYPIKLSYPQHPPTAPPTKILNTKRQYSLHPCPSQRLTLLPFIQFMRLLTSARTKLYFRRSHGISCSIAHLLSVAVSPLQPEWLLFYTAHAEFVLVAASRLRTPVLVTTYRAQDMFIVEFLWK